MQIHFAVTGRYSLLSCYSNFLTRLNAYMPIFRPPSSAESTEKLRVGPELLGLLLHCHNTVDFFARLGLYGTFSTESINLMVHELSAKVPVQYVE